MDQAAVNNIIRFLVTCLKEEGLNNTSIAVFGSKIPMDVLNLTPEEYHAMVRRNMFPSKVVA